jgi:hypothetical protein
MASVEDGHYMKTPRMSQYNYAGQNCTTRKCSRPFMGAPKKLAGREKPLYD